MDYKNGQIYTIRSHQTDMFYIGSTCTTLSKRIRQHKYNYENWKNDKYRYVTSFDILKYQDAYIELLEECPCETKKQLNKREGQHIRSQEKCVNKHIPDRTPKEYDKYYKLKNKEQIAEKNKKYYKEHQAEKFSEKHECECGGKYTSHHKLQHINSIRHQKHLAEKKEIKNIFIL